MKTFAKIALAAVMMLGMASQASAFDLRNAIRTAASAVTGTDSTATVPTGGSSIGDLIGSVAGAIGLTGNMTLADLEGEWKYKEPAVSFKSDNFLMQAGGVAAAAQVEKKLEPYYKMAGCDAMKVTFAADSTFSMKLRLGTFNGKISQSEDGKQIFFHFMALKAINIGTMEAFIQKDSSTQMEITFDVSSLLAILEKAGALTGKSSISTITSLLGQYDGMTAGFALTKVK